MTGFQGIGRRWSTVGTWQRVALEQRVASSGEGRTTGSLGCGFGKQGWVDLGIGKEGWRRTCTSEMGKERVGVAEARVMARCAEAVIGARRAKAEEAEWCTCLAKVRNWSVNGERGLGVGTIENHRCGWVPIGEHRHPKQNTGTAVCLGIHPNGERRSRKEEKWEKGMGIHLREGKRKSNSNFPLIKFGQFTFTNGYL